MFIKGSGSVDVRVLAGTWGDQLGATTCAASSSGWTQCQFSFATGSNPQVTFRMTNPGANDALYLDDAYLGQYDGVNVLPNGNFDSGNVNWVVQSPFSIVQNP